MRKMVRAGGIGILFFLSPLLWAETSPKSPESKPSPFSTNLGNPASINCVQQGGILLQKKRGDGGEYGVCVFEDDRQCEEWALLRGECRKGGVRVASYNKREQIYCAILGGTPSDMRDICTFKDGSACEQKDLFNGTCQKGEKRKEILSPFP